MKSYCVREKRITECVPGSEQIGTASNGTLMMRCKCASCGIMKTQFLPSNKSGQRGGAVGDDFSCGYDLKGKRAGTLEECYRKGQLRHWGIDKFTKDDLDDLLYDRKVDRMLARRLKNPPVKPMTKTKQKEYIDEIVADIKKETKARNAPKRKTTVDLGEINEMDSLLFPDKRKTTAEDKKVLKALNNLLGPVKFADEVEPGKAEIKKILKNNPELRTSTTAMIRPGEAISIRDKNYKQKYFALQDILNRRKNKVERENAIRFWREQRGLEEPFLTEKIKRNREGGYKLKF